MESDVPQKLNLEPSETTLRKRDFIQSIGHKDPCFDCGSAGPTFEIGLEGDNTALLCWACVQMHIQF